MASSTIDTGAGRADDGDAADRPGGRGGLQAARVAAIVVGLVLVVFIGLLATRKSADDRVNANPLVGKAVPRVVGTTLDGSSLDIDSLRGRWVVVNFFATWCTGCVIEHPELVRFSQAHKAAEDAQIVSIVFNDQVDPVRAFFKKQGGDWPVITSDDGRAAIDFGVTGIPESFVVAPNGLVVAHFEGVNAAALDDTINRYGGAPASAVPGTVVAPGGAVVPGVTAGGNTR